MRMPIVLVMLCAAMGSTVAAQPRTDEARQHKLDLQERCAQAAEKTFRSSGWKTELGSAYQSHYNQTLGVCLIEIEGHTEGGVTKSVSDAIEGRLYALYVWIQKPGKKYWEVPPVTCQLIPTQKEKRDCTSDREYTDFAASLMEQK
jgi:hypothetical protein